MADQPSSWITRFAHLVPAQAELLDLACGSGRHSRFFAARGARVCAVDRDAGALEGLAGVSGVRTLVADLEAGCWPFAADSFDAVVVTHYLHRPLFALIARSLRAGGVLLYETFMRGNEAYGRPSNPAFLLEPGELLAVFTPPLVPVAFEQGLIARPAVVQRLAAVREGPPRPRQIE